MQMKRLYVLVRYSVLVKKSGMWVIGRDTSFDEYRKALFDEARLAYHFRIFSGLTLPSLNAAIEKKGDLDVRCLVLTSDELPESHKKNLYGEAECYNWLSVHEISCDQSYSDAFEKLISSDLNNENGSVAIYGTTRLDDDDALPSDFVHIISEYLSESFVGMAISFPKGYSAYFQDGKITSFSEIVHPKIALGLTHVGKAGKEPRRTKTIYSFGSHSNIDRKLRIILDSRYYSYIRSLHEESDLSQRSAKRIINNGAHMDMEAIMDRFCIDEELLSLTLSEKTRESS